jgi:ribosomal protein S18 acetylase RimI-like enzyme
MRRPATSPATERAAACQHRSVVDPAGVLPNPIWHALGGEQAAVADSVGRARRFRVDVSPFCGLPDAPTTDDWDALRALVRPGGIALLMRDEIVAPEAWEPTFELRGVQMVLDTNGARSAAPRADPARFPIVTLGLGDVPDMLDLVARTEPGPFTPKTIELGTYLGVRVDGALIAMAGERMRPPGYTEVSAVCTDPAFRGQGLAAYLVDAVIDLIRARGDRPMLHAAGHNHGAIRLYEHLGFRLSRDVTAIMLRAPA